MSKVKSFNEFHQVHEADAPAQEAKSMVVDGVEYTAVPSTYKAVGAKQKELGQESVGIITLPNDPDIYELLPAEKKDGDKKKENKDDKG